MRLIVKGIRERLNKRKVLIWGACDKGDVLRQILSESNIPVDERYIDKLAERTELDNMIPPSFLTGVKKNFYIIIATNSYYPSIEKFLKENNYTEEMDYLYLVKPLSSEQFNTQYAKDINELAQLIEDCIANKHKEKIIEEMKVYDQNQEIVEIEAYRKKSNELLGKYKAFELCYLNKAHIANLAELLMETDDNRFGKENVLNIFIPVFWSDELLNLYYFDEKPTANEFIFQKLAEQITVVTKESVGFWRWFIKNYDEKVYFYDRYSVPQMVRENEYRDFKNNNLYRNKNYITFTKKEVELGREKSIKLGIKDKYICFFARSLRYHHEMEGDVTLEPINFVRTEPVEDFRWMCQKLFERNFQSVRMGQLVEGTISAPGIIDYGSNARDDFMDFYLMANCEFLVSNLNGIQWITQVVNKPMVSINAPFLTYTDDVVNRCNPNNDIMILQKIYNIKEKRYLTLKELLKIAESVSQTREQVEYIWNHPDLEFVKNTPQEIWEACEEMLLRVSGMFKYDDADIELQKKYRKILKSSLAKKERYYTDCAIGRLFLRQNQWLLD